MKDVIVVSGVTHRAGMLDEYTAQLAAAGVPFALEPYPHLSMGANSVSMAVKLEFLRRVAEIYSDYKTIINTDAWDVLFFGNYDDLVAAAPSKILISAERNCYPEPHLCNSIRNGGLWRYANAGTLAANREYLLRWLDAVQEIGDLNILDQMWYNRRLANGNLEIVPLDYETRLFYVESSTMEDDSLKVVDGRLWNSVYGTYPVFVHFSGQTSPERIKRMLA